MTTFPEHCMANTSGAAFVAETDPADPVVCDWDRENFNPDGIRGKRNVVIRKDVFDVFAGNPYTEEIVKILNPRLVVVYRLTTNVCVNDAVLGLAKRVGQVVVIEDAIKELPNIPLPFEAWKALDVKRIKLGDLQL